ncbi:MAG: ABC transporter permease subunit [Streptosporangiaceae bacterium]
MVTTAAGQPGSPAGLQDPPPGPGGYTARERVASLIRRRHLSPYLLLLPSVAVIGALVVWPAVQIGLFSFQDYGLPQVTGAAGTQWVGVSNYTTILSDPEFWLSLRISLIFAAVVVPLTLLTGTLVGLLLNRLGRRMATFVSGAALLAWATPAVSAGVIFVWLADPDGGIVDWTLSRLPHWLGGGAHWVGFSWTNSALPAYTLLTVLVLWQGFPFIAVSVLAGLKTIPAELHESARVDGGGPWRIFWRVTYPLLLPAAQADLPSAVAALGHLGLRRVHAGVYRHRRARQPGRVQPGHLRLRPSVLDAADLRRGVRTRVHPDHRPAHHHRRLRSVVHQARSAPMRLSRRSHRGTGAGVGLNALGVLVALVTLFPIFWMVSTAFKPASEIYSLTPHPFPDHPTLANFRTVIDGSVIGIPYWNFLKNSLFVTLVSVAAAMLIAMLAAIALARFRFRLRTSYLIMLLIVQMLPQQALVIALFLDFRRIGLLDSLVGLVAVYTAFALPVTIWLLRNFVAAVPREMEEAAAIDGAGPVRIFWRIMLPLVAPGLVATSVFAFIFAWNEFVFALTFLGTDTAKYTLPIYVQYFYGRGSVDWGGIMAASTLFTVPVMIFFLIVQRRMANGLVAGAVKG